MQESRGNLMDFEKPLTDIYKKIDDLKKLSNSGKINLSSEIEMLEKRIEQMRKELLSNLSPIQIVQLARHPQRPTTLDYIKLLCDDFVELRGDRCFGDDPAIVGGLATLGKRKALLLGHQKGKTTKENISRNFGMAHPEGYRKALRLFKMAERFDRPIITFVDTPGAYPGIGAEERGQAEAIARNLREMAGIQVPIVVVITGEGGSGGALGIGVGNRVIMFEYSVYSVISPEGCASILFRDAKRAPEAAASMKITAKDLLASGVVDEIIKEPTGGAHHDPALAAKNLRNAIEKHLTELDKMSHVQLVDDRMSKFRKMGEFIEVGR